MKVHLLYRDSDFDLAGLLPANEPDLAADLGLASVVAAMARGDDYLADVARRVLLRGLVEPDAIRYRQAILADCLAHPAAIREMYSIALTAIDAEKHVWMDAMARHPGGLLQRSIELLGKFFVALERLRRIAEENGKGVKSEGLRTLFAMLERELSDEYIRTVETQLARLSLRDGVLSTASLGDGNFGTDYVLRRPGKQGWLETVVGDRSARVLDVDERDMRAAETLSNLRDRGIAIAAGSLGKSTDHVLSFFAMLRLELGFYVACLNLHERLTELGEPVCFPEPRPAADRQLAAGELYDLSLALAMRAKVVGNDIHAEGKSLIAITGANRGGKSTFLRSVGLAQLMMQAGMFVAAEKYSADVCGAIFTHYRREEDESMTSGKLDEELRRMSGIVDAIGPNDLMLFNEAFASTNEREGSAIARQILRALLESGVKVFYVTHLYDLGHSLWRARRGDTVFLRAERLADGTRTFRLVEGEPLPTSYGEDLYRQVFPDRPVVAADDAEGDGTTSPRLTATAGTRGAGRQAARQR